jgi:transposase-like protein
VKKIIHNYPATVLVFKDGSKSVVKCEQEHDLEKAILYAWVKRYKKSKEYDWFIEMWKRNAIETLSRPSVFDQPYRYIFR